MKAERCGPHPQLSDVSFCALSPSLPARLTKGRPKGFGRSPPPAEPAVRNLAGLAEQGLLTRTVPDLAAALDVVSGRCRARPALPEGRRVSANPVRAGNSLLKRLPARI